MVLRFWSSSLYQLGAGIIVCAGTSSYVMLGMEPRTLCMPGRYSTNWATSIAWIGTLKPPWAWSCHGSGKGQLSYCFRSSENTSKPRLHAKRKDSQLKTSLLRERGRCPIQFLHNLMLWFNLMRIGQDFITVDCHHSTPAVNWDSTPQTLCLWGFCYSQLDPFSLSGTLRTCKEVAVDLWNISLLYKSTLQTSFSTELELCCGQMSTIQKKRSLLF